MKTENSKLNTPLILMPIIGIWFTLASLFKDIRAFFTSESHPNRQFGVHKKHQLNEKHALYFFVIYALITGSIGYVMINYDLLVALRVKEYHRDIHDAAEFLTEIGGSTWIVTLCILFLLLSPLLYMRFFSFLKHQKYWVIFLRQRVWMMLATVIFSGLSVNLLKYTLGRPRPTMLDQYDALHFDFLRFESSFASFPSGHATTAMAMAMMLALFIPSKKWLFISFGIIIASTRVFISAHYPSDVMAGMVYGGLGSLLTYYIMANKSYYISKRKFKPQLKIPLK